MESERCAIIELFKAGKTPPQILKELYIAKSRRKVIYRTINRFDKTGEMRDKPRSGRPCSVTTSVLKKAIRERIRRNPRRSMRKMALEPIGSKRCEKRPTDALFQTPKGTLPFG